MATFRRIGVLVPSSNTVFEDYCHDSLPADLRVHFARISVTRIGADRESLAQFEADRMLEAVSLLAEARPAHLVWGGTAAGWLGFGRDRDLCARIEAHTGIPASSSLLSVNARLAALGVRRIGLVTPYEADIEAQIVANYRAEGIAVAASARLDLTVNTDYAAVPPARLLEMSRQVARDGAEAVVILCTNLAGAPIAAEAEAATGLPVLDSVIETFRPLLA